MEITRVSVYKVEREDSRVKGFATIEIDDALVVTNIRIIEGEKRMFCAMPNRPNHKSDVAKWDDIVFPKNQEVRDLIEKKILDEYKRVSK